MEINLGPKVDLFRKEDGTYRFMDYYQFFSRDYGRTPEIMEFHLLLRDIKNPGRLAEGLEKIADFSEKNKLKALGFHYPDEQIPSEVAWLRRTLKQIGRKEIRKGAELPSINEATERFYGTIDSLIKTGSSPPPILVTHKGGVQLEKEFFMNQSEKELLQLREEYFNQLLKEHIKILEYCGKRLRLGLENTSTVGLDDAEGYLCEQAFEHFQPRLSLGGVYILDTAHAAMCSYHQCQKDLKLKDIKRSMQSVEAENKPSLKSLEEHIRIAGPFTEWMHLADAAGAKLSDEGLPLGAEGSLINWQAALNSIKQYVKVPNLILEIHNSHNDYQSTIGDSLRYLRRNNLIYSGEHK